MNKLLSAFLLLCTFAVANVYAAPATMNAAGTKLVKNGEGSRTVLGVKVYTGALYLKSKSRSGDAIAKANEPMAFSLKVTSSLITKEKMSKVVYKGFEKSTGSKTAMKKEINALIGLFADGVKKGDVYKFVYVPGKGTHLYKNGKLGAVTKGLRFKQALFGLWIGKNPAQGSLKKALLGG